jgi:hypothetical protein
MASPAALLLVASLALTIPAAAEDGNTTLDWTRSTSTWEQASLADGDQKLWSQPNFCDGRVLRGSAPLTVLFGVSTFWDEIRHRRDTLAASGAAPPEGKPLEVHVLGAAYPFEGRSDWSLLASRRPADVPKVRVVLVLGTPWHQDNVPVMEAQEFDETRSFLMQIEETRSSKVRARGPEVGKWKRGAIHCAQDGSVTSTDVSFMRKDLCKDHGNGLEVVCMEKYYQDVSEELPKPDVVVMFSPGFPQIARRSWDKVLRQLLEMEVPIMVGDLLYSDAVDHVFLQQKSKTLAKPGAKWAVQTSRFEDGMTLRTMRAYGARKLGSFRNPFPIFITRGHDDVTAKNAVLQVFRGRLNHAKPLTLPSNKSTARRMKLIGGLDLKHFMDDEDSAEEIKSSMLIPTSKAYDKAMWKIYRAQIQDFVESKIKRSEKHKRPLDPEWLEQVKLMGLTGKPRRKPWNLDEWMFILTDLRVADEFFF